MPEYSPAPDAERIAQKLIADHHTHLTDVRVEFVFRDKASKSNGKVVLGKARKISGLNAFLARDDRDATYGEDFFVIELAEDEWLEMPASKRRALVDHELCHCTIDFDEDKGIVTLGLRAHDVEEFKEIVDRHGLWKDDLAEFAKAAKEQLDLFGERGAPTALDEAMADFAEAATANGMTTTISTSDGDSVTIDDDTAKALRERAR